MEKETLEEAAKNTTSKYINEREKQTAYLEFIEGAKWQAEKMCEIMNAYTDDVMGGCNLRAKEWFEQFKKK
jgi:hypothetical protein